MKMIRAFIGFIGFVLMCNEQLYPEPQNWNINIIGAVILIWAIWPLILNKNERNFKKNS